MGNLTMESLLIALSGFVIVFIILAVLSGMIVLISRVVGAVAGQTAAAPPASAPAVPAVERPAVPAFAPVVLTGVDDLTAACIMAIVSDETGCSLDELAFRSIKAL